MKISDVKTYVVGNPPPHYGGLYFVFLKLTTDSGIDGFGEAYFSTIHLNVVKGWKKHRMMTLNLVVPVGSIKIVLFDEGNKEFLEVTLGQENYQRLTVGKGIWMAFKGEAEGLNILLNVANIEHDPEEVESCELDKIPYCWG